MIVIYAIVCTVVLVVAIGFVDLLLFVLNENKHAREQQERRSRKQQGHKGARP